MISIRLDSKGDLLVRWPSKDLEILNLSQSYLDYEGNLPVDQQITTPTLSMVQETLEKARVAVDSASDGEASRATAAEIHRQTMSEARPLMEVVLLHLKSKYADNLAQLSAWGLKTKRAKRGISVLKPTSDNKWVNFLQAYVIQESSLPEGERLTDPPLDKLTALVEKVRQSREARDSGKTQREMGVKERSTIVAQLLHLLQVAAIVLVATRYGSKVTNDLQQWGYDVVARGSGKKIEKEQEE
jgi:hypothetical protein